MKINKLQDLTIQNLDNLNSFFFEGLTYERIYLKDGESVIRFYNRDERHLIEVKKPNYVKASYCILRQVKLNEYTR